MIIYLLYRLVFLSSFMACLTQLKYGIKKTSIIVSAFILAIWIINFPIFMYKGLDFFNYVWPLTVTVPACICFFLLSKLDLYKVLFSFFTICNFGMLTSYIGFLSFVMFKSFAIRVLFEILSSTALMVFMIKVFRKPYFKVQKTLKKGWGPLCTVPLLLSVIIYILLYYPSEIYNRPEDILVAFLSFVLLFVIYSVVYLNFENISQYYQLKRDKELMLLQTELQKKEYTAIMEKVNGIRIYRHDMKHQIDTISTFLNDSNLSEAQKYLSKLGNNFSKTVIENYCENYGANCILSSYISRAKDEQINVSCNANISAEINIEDIELGLIFSNALENAINASKKIENPNERKISIVCKDHCEQICIQISNTFEGEILFDGEFPVSNRKDHGFGTQSIAAIAQKYGGICSFIAENGIFKATVILNCR
jgi:hypothetical protein